MKQRCASPLRNDRYYFCTISLNLLVSLFRSATQDCVSLSRMDRLILSQRRPELWESWETSYLVLRKERKLQLKILASSLAPFWTNYSKMLQRRASNKLSHPLNRRNKLLLALRCRIQIAALLLLRELYILIWFLWHNTNEESCSSHVHGWPFCALWLPSFYIHV